MPRRINVLALTGTGTWNRTTKLGIALTIAVSSAWLAARFDLLPAALSNQSRVNQSRQAPARNGKFAVYRYSVVPGGIHSTAGLHHALLTDPVVRGHYLGFDAARAHLVQAAAPRRFYVSYRKDETVFWTRKPVVIPKGEWLITDGEHYARTRCGNRLSVTPPPGAPSASEQPSEAALDSADSSPWGEIQPQAGSDSSTTPDRSAQRQTGEQEQAVVSNAPNPSTGTGTWRGDSGGASGMAAGAGSAASRPATGQNRTDVDKKGSQDSAASSTGEVSATDAAATNRPVSPQPPPTLVLPSSGPASRLYPIGSGLNPQTDFNRLLPAVVTTPQHNLGRDALPPDFHPRADLILSRAPAKSSESETGAHPSRPPGTEFSPPRPQLSLFPGTVPEFTHSQPAVPEPGTLSFLLLTIGAAALYRWGFRRRSHPFRR
ncbi:MAG: PEP-CTERM sorting domain-containing protein [Acidobacteriota bacterium]|nr:PEP-CTERM sorting domain-containing protein [Acidobacteriota bacterium]